MQGNLHVQFLGGQARATAPGYPATLESYARDGRLHTRGDLDRIAAMVDGGGAPQNALVCWRAL